MIELALPAGTLDKAMAAFVNGADAVYFGMQDFSARKSAGNFTEDDLARIRRYAADNGRKVYVTANTLVDDSELEEADKLLGMLDSYEPDGIIIQDLGLVRLVKERWPHLPLHGSTQLAVHTVEGVKALQDLGFERVVLSRELTLDEIAYIRATCPDIELKVFIHGALCYGFSGLCMASANICGRSANRGECAQVCRTWFTDNGTNRNGYFFSMEDLAAGRTLLTLNEMGIESAKIEGRMKDEGYVASLTRYYRALLDGGDADALEEAWRTSFSRRSGQGWFDYRKDRDSLLSGYPGHLGTRCGLIVDQDDVSITVRKDCKLLPRDGLQYITTDSKGLPKATAFPCEILSRDGSYIRLRHKANEDLVGLPLYKKSSATGHEKKATPPTATWKQAVDITFTIAPDRLIAEALGAKVECEVTLQEAKTPGDIHRQVSDVFLQSDTSRYTLGKLEVVNDSGLLNPFIPLSRLKALRRDFYKAIDSIKTDTKPIEWPQGGFKAVQLPDRKRLEGDLPWSLVPREDDGQRYITLPPVTFNEEGLKEELDTLLRANPDLMVGLNNIGQVRIIKEHPGTRCFADIYLYLPNAAAAWLLAEELGIQLTGGYLWMERKEHGGHWPFEPTITSYTPPSFISRACYRHDAMGLPCSSCTGKADFHIHQNDKRYRVKVRDCLTVVSLE